MMIVKMMDGNKYEITDEEYKSLNTVSGNFVHFKSCDVVVNKNSISSIHPQKLTEVADRKIQSRGVLHDGTKVIRHFGTWICEGLSSGDDNGNPKPVNLDRQFYPEIALDYVATPEEYEKIKSQGLNYYDFLKIGERIKRLASKQQSQSIADVISKKL